VPNRRRRLPAFLVLSAALLVPARRNEAASRGAAELAAYHAALQRVESRIKGSSVEAVFDAAFAVKEALLRNEGNLAVIERLSERELEQLTRSTRGIILNRDEVLLAEPDAVFFLALARKYGRAVDVAFFKQYAATFPEGVWPSYVEQQTDVTGCTLFGAGELVSRYAGWRRFQMRHPRNYRRGTAERIGDLEEHLTESTCACGSREDVLRDIEEFVKRFPGTRVAKKIRSRLKALRDGQSDIRFNCLSDDQRQRGTARALA
jgi:hypothetical protein